MASSSVIMKSSNVFFLAIVLLVCSSYANDDIPQVTSEVHRKLISLRPFLGIINALKKNPLPKINYRDDVPNVCTPSEKQVPQLGRQVVSEVNASPNYINRYGFWRPTEEEVFEIGLKVVAANTVKKLFGADAEKGFRLGWRVGKWYYSVENKCEKYGNEYLQCPKTWQYCIPSSERPTSCSCIVEIVQGISSSPRTCYEKNDVTQETPYFQYPGSYQLVVFGGVTSYVTYGDAYNNSILLSRPNTLVPKPTSGVQDWRGGIQLVIVMILAVYFV